MVTPFYSNKYTGSTLKQPARFLPAGYITQQTATYTFAGTAALPLDVFNMFSIPSGAYLVDLVLDSDDLDSGGTPTISFDVGTSGTATLFIGSSTVGQAGGVTRAAKAGSVGYSFTRDTTIQVRIETPPQAGGTTGTFRLAAYYTTDQ